VQEQIELGRRRHVVQGFQCGAHDRRRAAPRREGPLGGQEATRSERTWGRIMGRGGESWCVQHDA
jgi:hypothetical protein